VPARTAASVVQIWSIAADTCANLQAPWRTHKPLIRLGFRCLVVPGRRPEGPLERTFNLLLRDPGASQAGGRRSRSGQARARLDLELVACEQRPRRRRKVEERAAVEAREETAVDVKPGPWQGSLFPDALRQELRGN
jgi:hypothetical protein